MMKNLFSSLSAALATALLTTIPCVAQEQESGDVTVRSAILPGAGIEDSLELYLGENGRSRTVTVWGGKFSPEFELPRRDVWRFGHWETEENENGGEVQVFNERGRVVPPDGERIWLVFFKQEAGEKAPLQVQAFGVDEAMLAEGGIVVLNLSQGPVGVEIKDVKTRVDPLKREFLEPDAEEGEPYPVKFYFSHDGEARPFVMTNWFRGERRRRLAMVVQADASSAPKLLVIDDIMARDDPEE